MAVGGGAGRRALPLAWLQMTSMPEMVALFNGFGGAASLLVGGQPLTAADSAVFTLVITIVLSILIGGVTLTGSLVAYGKLSARRSAVRRFSSAAQQMVNSAVILFRDFCVSGWLFCLYPDEPTLADR
jgi:NAD(P) transhydrogenase subunit beta